MNSLIRKQWFSLAIISSIIIAYTLVKLGLTLSEPYSSYAKFSFILVIFLLSGLSVETDRLRHSVKQWRIHLFIQITSFIIFPLIIVPVAWLVIPSGTENPVYIGFVVLACIPTTITSCVVFTRNAAGNEECALFNASLANILGIVITPLLVYLLISKSIQLDPLEAIKKLSLLVVLPFFIGQTIRNHGSTKINLSQTKMINNAMVLGILVIAFIKTFEQGIQIELNQILNIALLSLCFKLSLTFLAWHLSSRLISNLKLADQKCITLTATPKTLALGLPLISILYAGNPALALISLPMITYYTIQLFIDSFLVGYLAELK